MFRSLKNGMVGALFFVSMLSANHLVAQDGGGLFNSKCASCHQPHQDGTGPKLFQARKKWEDGGAKPGSIYTWVNNWQNAAASDPYAKSVSTWSPTAMSAFPDLKKEQIDAILDWVDAQPAPDAGGAGGKDGAAGDGGAAPGEEDAEEESSMGWIWVILAVVFIIIILSVGSVRRQLTEATNEVEGKPAPEEGVTYGLELKAWLWKHRLFAGICALVLVIGTVVSTFLMLYNIGVVEGYQPTQPIAFPHEIHAGTNGIDCKYCHSSVTKSKTAGIPSVNVCMNCHKQVKGRTPEQQEQIKKIYAAAGFDPSGPGKYTGKSKPIVWNKVHVLPDHVYFNHSQHVVVGGVDCAQCHGDMKKQKETQKVWPVEELNKIDGNIKLTKPTMTMGWCIECHDQKEISKGDLKAKNSGYYDEIHKRLLNNDRKLYGKYLKDGNVTVKELGGWECAKCHY